ncbi:MAG: DUF192 domain-containing protein [Candidatus Taylorbacteria bacterium]|nr:DUF192 domain-containing protein [Candidatus Taylorbacteria bacterium]
MEANSEKDSEKKSKFFITFIVLGVLILVGGIINHIPSAKVVDPIQNTSMDGKDFDLKFDVRAINKLKINGQEINIIRAQTNEEEIQGLSGRDSLALNSGMLFYFDHDDFWKFWMKDMKFSIDIIWLDKDFRIIDIKNNATPLSYPELFTSKNVARYVLEVPAGFAQNYLLKDGVAFTPEM